MHQATDNAGYWNVQERKADSATSNRPFNSRTLSPAATKTESGDFDELVSSIRSWDKQIDQISQGRFRGTVWHAEVGECNFVNACCNQSLQLTGRATPDCFVLAPVHSGNFQSRFRTRQLPVGMMNVLIPNEAVNHVTACEFQTSQIEIPVAMMQTIGQEFLNVDACELLSRSMGVPVGQGRCDFFNSKLCDELERLAIQKDNGSTNRLFSLAKQMIIAVLENAVTIAPAKGPDKRRVLFHRAVAILKQGLDRWITTKGVCDQLDISERTLTNLFTDYFGQSPMRYLRILRFNQIRRDLKAAGNTDRIHAITRNCGIEYSGVFAGEYKKHFGELPSTTARS